MLMHHRPYACKGPLLCFPCSKVFASVGLDSRLRDLWKHVSRRCGLRMWGTLLSVVTARLVCIPQLWLCHLLLSLRSPEQLVDNIALFKQAENKQPLMLVPGRPPLVLPLDVPLMATGAVKEGQRQVGKPGRWTACFSGLSSEEENAPFSYRRTVAIWLYLGCPLQLQPDSCGRYMLLARIQSVSPLPCCSEIMQVKLAVAFQDIDLLPTDSIAAVPLGDNPALLRSACTWASPSCSAAHACPCAVADCKLLV